MYADFGSHVVVVEIDEHKHEQYECSENKRMMAIFVTLTIVL
jgi:hypothetical protein